jgi:predicted acyltransferase
MGTCHGRYMRLKSLDVLRGLTIITMLLVNFQGDFEATYAPFVHSRWHGCTLADAVFPCFLFIVGVTTHISISARRARGATDRELALQIGRRAVILIALGLFLSAFPFVPATRVLHMRIPGVLQRIGAAYCLAALLGLRTTVRQQTGILAAILVGYWLTVRLYPLDIPTETLSARVDRFFMAGHLGRKGWDRMGILPIFPAAGTVMLGMLCGRWLETPTAIGVRVRGLAGAGCAGIVAGLLWDRVFPINQSLWTSSYVLFTAGTSALALSACLWIVDEKRWDRWSAPLLVLGTNPIAAYVGATMTEHVLYHAVSAREAGVEIDMFHFLYLRGFASWLAPERASLAFALAGVSLWWILLYPLYRRKIFLKI